MEVAVEVAAPSAVVVAKLMGSQEGSGNGNMVVGETRWHNEGACSSAGRKEKNQIKLQNNSSISRRGEKRSTRVKHKSRCDPFSLKNGIVGFNSPAGGNNFLGMYGLKPDAFDITNFVNDLPLHDLISGNFTSPCISKNKGKTCASSNNDLMQSVRKACSVLQPQRGLHAQNNDDIDNGCIHSDSINLITVNSVGSQADIDKGDNCTPLLQSTDEVQESDEKVRKSSIADFPIYTPKYIFKRLALPLPKDLDLLLSESSKTTLKIDNDPRAGKPAPQRIGLPPFPWSHSLSGHTKLGSDAVKLSGNRTLCQGRWGKVRNPVALQKGSSKSLADFESLAFDQCLVPSENLLSQKQEDIFASTNCALSTSGASSTSKVASDECSSSHAAAQTLLDMAACSKENSRAVVKWLKRPPQMTMKASKSKTIKRCDLLDVNLKIRPTNALKVSDGFSSKKLKLSKDASNACISQTQFVRQGKVHPAVLPIRSPPRKLSRDSNASSDSYGINLVKKSCVLKAPRVVDRPVSTNTKFWKPS